ncbi:MAG TPA: MmgE/PrpD family protein [Solirubrobacteraceae bacterium]|nr:MmgE/PrpD family protein [Solirubrobacteraceae bacterium]
MTGARAAHRAALLDWLACAAGGRHMRAAAAAHAAGDGLLETVVALGAAGHVLDFDDTYLPGIAHLSAASAPAALAVGAALGASVGEVAAAHAAGFERAAALARAGHPALYERGWHPTAVCGTIGAAAAAARLFGLAGEAHESALALAALRAGGSRAGFGSDGKALGVGLAAADGVHAARLAAGGARMAMSALEGPAGYAATTGGTWAAPAPDEPPAVHENWIKPWPCCLMAHAPIEAALDAPHAAERAALVVRVHPRARQAAPYDEVADGLQARFSIPYLTAFALVRGAPDVEGLAAVDEEVSAFATERVRIVEDPALGESEARLEDGDGGLLSAVRSSMGSPQRPLTEAQLAAKVRRLAGDRLHGALRDDRAPAAELLAALG